MNYPYHSLWSIFGPGITLIFTPIALILLWSLRQLHKWATWWIIRTWDRPLSRSESMAKTTCFSQLTCQEFPLRIFAGVHSTVGCSISMHCTHLYIYTSFCIICSIYVILYSFTTTFFSPLPALRRPASWMSPAVCWVHRPCSSLPADRRGSGSKWPEYATKGWSICLDL